MTVATVAGEGVSERLGVDKPGCILADSSAARLDPIEALRHESFVAQFRENAMTLEQSERRSPRIEHISWGRMTVESVGSGKDFKLWPGGGRPWDWAETGTHHVPGIQPADVEELLEHGSNVIVLSRGVLMRLRTCKQTLELLDAKGVEVKVAETMVAAKLYNRLAAGGRAVGGLFHSTC